MAYPNQPGAPIATGIASFLGAFGDRLAKAQDSDAKLKGKEALDAIKQDYAKKLEVQKEAGKKGLAEDPNKVAPKGTGRTGVTDPQLANAQKTLKAVDKIENHLKTFGDTIANPMNTNNNPIVVNHYLQYYKEALATGKNANDAMNVAKQRVFKDSYPDEASALYNAHAGGTVAHIFQNYPQLATQFPVVALKYKVAPAPNANPAPAPKVNPGANVPAPTINTQRQAPPTAPTPAPQQTSMAPQSAPPMQMAQAPTQPIPGAGENTMIPGQGPAGSQAEDVDETPAIG